MTDLKPCPCGKEAEINAGWSWTEDDGRTRYGTMVQCSINGCWIGPTAEGRTMAVAAQGAVKKWNRREP